MKKSFELAASANRALLGVITINIKAIAVYVDNQNILNLKAYFYNEPSESEKEDLRVVETEISADFEPNDIKEFKDQFIVWDGREKLNNKENLVYLRRD